jgi:hypothetical protein
MPNDPYDLPNAAARTAIFRRPPGGGQALAVSTAALADHVCDSWHRRPRSAFPETADPSTQGGRSPVSHPSCEYRRVGRREKNSRNPEIPGLRFKAASGSSGTARRRILGALTPDLREDGRAPGLWLGRDPLEGLVNGSVAVELRVCAADGCEELFEPNRRGRPGEGTQGAGPIHLSRTYAASATAPLAPATAKTSLAGLGGTVRRGVPQLS